RLVPLQNRELKRAFLVEIGSLKVRAGQERDVPIVPACAEAGAAAAQEQHGPDEQADHHPLALFLGRLLLAAPFVVGGLGRPGGLRGLCRGGGRGGRGGGRGGGIGFLGGDREGLAALRAFHALARRHGGRRLHHGAAFGAFQGLRHGDSSPFRGET